ncbi:MAG: PEP-utilizing enzyme, partial [Acidimicrobiia bacterium]|nr:PEP-utilizing enzyme [Acidimicrobiia bacterium]
RYCDFYTDVLAPADAAEPLDTLQGFHTRSVDASRGIWTLSRRARPHPELVAALDSLSGPTAEVLTALAAVPGGRDFGAELVAYLDEFGWRSDAVYDVGDVTWREEPTVVLRTVARYCNLGDEADPERHFAAALRRRDELVAAARTALADRPNELARFDELYEMARHNLSITEDHAFWIDQTSIALFRRYLQEVGRRLVGRGVIDDIEDVFCLYRAEVEAAMADGVRRAELVAERRAELAAANSVVPPRSLGVPPPPSDDPLIDALRVRLIGAVAPGEPPPPGMLRGICGSPGVVVGTARVVRSLAEAAKLDEGDILVCEMTLPPWVPLFAIAGGVVADTGGVLSHCAIVAREYGLPAVVGTQVGTATIRDGSTIRVDGERGLVELEYEPGS